MCCVPACLPHVLVAAPNLLGAPGCPDEALQRCQNSTNFNNVMFPFRPAAPAPAPAPAPTLSMSQRAGRTYSSLPPGWNSSVKICGGKGKGVQSAGGKARKGVHVSRHERSRSKGHGGWAVGARPEGNVKGTWREEQWRGA